MSGTVADLIAALQQQDRTLPVQLEGCDCIGSWSGEVEVVDPTVRAWPRGVPPYLLIRRED